MRNSQKLIASFLSFVLVLSLVLSACAPSESQEEAPTGSESTGSSQSGTTNETGSSTGTSESTGTTENTTSTENTQTTESTGSTESTGNTEGTQNTESTESTSGTTASHTHSYKESVVAPTCSKNGYTTYTCSCGDSYQDKETPANGQHSGVTGTCSYCGKSPIPAFTVGTQRGSLYDCGGNNRLLVYNKVTIADVKNYENTLKSSGYTLVQDNEIGNNRFATYTKGEQMIHVSFFAADGEIRITYGAKTYMGNTQPVSGYSQVVTPSVSMIEIGGTGLSMVIQLADGSFIVIDGGQGQDTSDAQQAADLARLVNFLKEKAPAGTKPQITWMITHAHPDHIVIASRLLANHKNEVNVNLVCYNFPVYSELTTNANTFVSRVKQYFPKAEHYVMHTGNKLYLPGCEIEFLYTASEDLYPTSFTNGNQTSNSWRFTIEGKTILITGDIQTQSCDKMVNNYGNYLASNVLQVVHHGVNGATKAFYQKVTNGNKLEVCFWPIREDNTNYNVAKLIKGELLSYSYNKVLYDSGARNYFLNKTTTLLLPSLTEN